MTPTLPRTRAYHEIWLDHEKVVSTQQPEEEPLYGPTYLPRKFKSGLAIDGDNRIDVYSLGWHQQRNGRWFLGVWVENGRIADSDGICRKTAFGEVVERFRRC